MVLGTYFVYIVYVLFYDCSSLKISILWYINFFSATKETLGNLSQKMMQITFYLSKLVCNGTPHPPMVILFHTFEF